MSELRFDVFLSHTSHDKPTIERIAAKLVGFGLRPWLDSWCLTPGGRWQEEIVDGITACRSFAIFVGPNGIGDWAREELAIAKDRAAKDRSFRVFPVLLPGLPDPFDPSGLPPFLSTHTWVDLRSGYENERIFQRLINAIHGVPYGSAAVAFPAQGICPYRGLEAFGEDHAAFFFGRESDTQRLIEQLKTDRILAVVGPSGSGKSSLVRAGLIPALRQGRIPGSEAWEIAVFRPGAHPLAALAAQLVRLLPGRAMQATLDGLAGDQRSLHLAATLALTDMPASARLVLVIDQFEEIFTLGQDAVERRAFLDNLLYAASIPGGSCTVVLVMRADFYQRCAVVPELAARIATRQYLVTPLTAEAVQAAVVQPAWQVGLTFEEGLVETILDDVASQPGSLPLLEHALLELWSRRRGTLLTLEGYRDTCGVAGALAQRADQVYQALPPASQDAARRVLLRLTQPGEGTEDTRRRAMLAELNDGTGDAAGDAIGALVEARLLTTGRDDETGEPTVDVAHEALIRSWPRLRGWIDEDRAGLRIHRRLTEAALEWDRSGREPGLLYRGTRLNETEGLTARQPDRLNTLEQEFLTEGIAERNREIETANERQRSRELLRRRIMAGLAVFSALALLLTAVAVWQWWEAGRQRDTAQAAQASALSRQIAAQALNQRTGGLDLRLLLAVEANRLNPNDVDTRGSLLTLLESSPHLETFMHDPLGRDTAELAFARGNQLIVSLAVDGSILVRDLETRQLAHTLLPADGGIYSTMVVSSDGQTLAAVRADEGGTERAIVLFDLARMQVSGELAIEEPNDSAVSLRLRFSPDGSVIVAARGASPQDVAPANVGQFDVWNIKEGQNLVQKIFAHGQGVWAVDFSPDGSLMVSGGMDGFVRFWDTATWAPVGQPLGVRSQIYDVRISPDGRHLAVAVLEGRLVVWDLDGSNVARVREANLSTIIYNIAFSPDSTLVAVGGENGNVLLWSVGGEQLEQETLAGHAGRVDAVGFSPDGRYLASAGFGASVALWNLQGSAHLGTSQPVPAVALSPDGMLAVAKDGNTITIRDLQSGETLREVQIDFAASVFVFCLSPDGQRLATVSPTGSISVWSTSTGQMLGALTDPAKQVFTAVAFSNDGALIATGTHSGEVSLWDGHSFTRLGAALGSHDNFVADVEFSPDDAALASTAWDSQVQVWDTTSHDRLMQLHIVQPLTAVAFSPDNRLVAAASGAGELYLWDRVDGQLSGAPLVSDGGSLWAVAFAPDGQTIAAVGNTGHITMWDVETRSPIGDPLVVDGLQVTGLVFTPDSALLQSMTQRIEAPLPADVIDWHVSVDGWSALACAVAARNLTQDEWSQYFGQAAYHATCPALPIPGDETTAAVRESLSPVRIARRSGD